MYLQESDMDEETENFAFACHRMTRGVKRLMEQRELSLRNKKSEGEVIFEVRHDDGMKFVRVFRMPVVRNRALLENKLCLCEEKSDGISSESSLDNKKEGFKKDVSSVSNFFAKVFDQIRRKCLSCIRNVVSDKNVGIAP